MAYVVTGRKDTGETHPRREIRDLYENYPEHFTLFILGLTAVQYPTSGIPAIPGLENFTVAKLLPPGGDWFSIGGIHGIPYERWPGDPPVGILSETENTAECQRLAGQPVKGDRPVDQSAPGISEDSKPKVPFPGDETARYGGYCNHQSVHFPPWHRPYLMVLEQSIGISATAIVEELVKGADAATAAKWRQAAKELRFPFWDWTTPDTVTKGFPDVLEKTTLRVSLPSGRSKSIVNPIACFKFDAHMGTERTQDFVDFKAKVPYSGEPAQFVEAHFKSWNRTCRWPLDKPEPNDDLESINYQLARLYDDLRSKVAHLFVFEEEPDEDKWPRIWDEFSNTWVQTDSVEKPQGTNISKSLEAAHNSIHLIVGGIGHMGQNEFAAFDPVFYLHHCNVDRIYALWEYVYPNYRMGGGYKDEQTKKLKFFFQPQGTFTQLADTRLDQWTDMLPWRKNVKSYWTPEDVGSLELKEGVWQKYYTYPPVQGVQVDKTVSYEERKRLRGVLQRHFGSDFKTARTETEDHKSPIFQNHALVVPTQRVQLEKYRHFVIVVELKEHTYGDSYSFELVYTSGTEPDPNNPGRTREKRIFGHVAVLSRPLGTSCAGCIGRQAHGSTVRGMIHVPSRHVVGWLDPRVRTRTDYTEEDEAAFCKRRFHARLVGRGGRVFAHTMPDAVPAAQRLPKAETPTVTFCTAYACTEQVNGDGPVELFGWKMFSEVFPGENWAVGPETAASHWDE